VIAYLLHGERRATKICPWAGVQCLQTGSSLGRVMTHKVKGRRMNRLMKWLSALAIMLGFSAEQSWALTNSVSSVFVSTTEDVSDVFDGFVGLKVAFLVVLVGLGIAVKFLPKSKKIV